LWDVSRTRNAEREDFEVFVDEAFGDVEGARDGGFIESSFDSEVGVSAEGVVGGAV